MDWYTKEELLTRFRGLADNYLRDVISKQRDIKKKAMLINRYLTNLRDDLYDETILVVAREEQWNNSQVMDAILLMNYVYYIVMLEYRNKVWNYEYMAFSRRIGELWEPFCKLPFEFPVNRLTLVEPPEFNDIADELRESITHYIDTLHLSDEEKTQLSTYYDDVWYFVSSGAIQLKLDLHFEKDDVFYNVDYKSGFSSNEKGNTNRLLMVASIYRNLGENQRALAFVRQSEEENNHYLQTLINSGLWDVFCANDAYDKIFEFTGFNLRNWMDINMNWEADISEEFRTYLTEHDLTKYLTW